MLTYVVPKPRITGTGETRIPARMVPQMREPIADQNVNWIVTQNAGHNCGPMSSQSSLTTGHLLTSGPRGTVWTSIRGMRGRRASV
ncbi:Uncharacterised protein [Mycobacteroides abscessus subsp. abscessus]|nr:Uncharacterised protein [Mycobacteroides abscessus subsp. abscessus]